MRRQLTIASLPLSRPQDSTRASPGKQPHYIARLFMLQLMCKPPSASPHPSDTIHPFASNSVCAAAQPHTVSQLLIRYREDEVTGLRYKRMGRIHYFILPRPFTRSLLPLPKLNRYSTPLVFVKHYAIVNRHQIGFRERCLDLSRVLKCACPFYGIKQGLSDSVAPTHNLVQRLVCLRNPPFMEARGSRVTNTFRTLN